MKRCLIGIFIILGTGQIVPESFTKDEKYVLKEQTLQMFRHAFDSYMNNAYPADELMPLRTDINLYYILLTHFWLKNPI